MQNLLEFSEFNKLVEEEKKTNNFQQLSENLFEEIAATLKKLDEEIKKAERENDYVKRRMATQEKENWWKAIEDFIKQRERKLIQKVQIAAREGKIDTRNMIRSERETFEAMLNHLKIWKDGIYEILMGKKKKKEVTEEKKEEKIEEKQQAKRKILKIIRDIPSFVGVDKKVYGPFKKGDIVYLPEDVAKTLKKVGFAGELCEIPS